jgi:hypothetical protein
MEQKTGKRSFYDEFFQGYGAEVGLSRPVFLPELNA